MIASKILLAAIGLLVIGGNAYPQRDPENLQWTAEEGVSDMLKDVRFETDVLTREEEEKRLKCPLAANLSVPVTRDGVVEFALTRNRHICNTAVLKLELRLYYDRRYLNLGCMGLNDKPWMKAGELMMDFRGDITYERHSVIFQMVQTKNKLPLLLGFMGKVPVLSYKPDVNNLRKRDYWRCYSHMVSPTIAFIYNSDSLTIEMSQVGDHRVPLMLMSDIHKLPDTSDNVMYS